MNREMAKDVITEQCAISVSKGQQRCWSISETNHKPRLVKKNDNVNKQSEMMVDFVSA